MAEPEFDNFADVNARLKEILDAVSDDAIAFDDALLLYEEAVKLGIAASNLIEIDVEEEAETLVEAPGAAALVTEVAATETSDTAPDPEAPGAASEPAAMPSDSASANAAPEDARP